MARIWPLLSDEELQRTVDAKARHGSNKATARALGIDPKTLRDRLARAAQRGMLGYKPVLPGYAVKQISTQRDADGNVEKEWVQQHLEAGKKFEVPPGHIVKGVSSLVDRDGRERAAWIKTRIDPSQDVVAAIHAAFKEYKGRARPIAKPRRVEHDLLSVYPIADQHVGLLAWGKEAGENYDLKIAAQRFRECTARLFAQSPPAKRAIILNLGDWTHNDDGRNMTPASGNLLDVDGRYFKVLTTGVQLMQDAIELALTRHEHVTVRNIPGNHDPHASIALTVALGAFYSKNKRVTVDDDPSDFFFHRFGATLIGATHGHKMKPADMAMTMAVQQRQDWGATKYHWFLFGHIHHESAREVGDVRVESFQTIAAKDAYAAGRGYRSGQSLVSITLHKRDGEIGRHRVNIPPPQHS